MGMGGGGGGRGALHTGEQHLGLPVEELQHLALETGVTQRHACEMFRRR